MLSLVVQLLFSGFTKASDQSSNICPCPCLEYASGKIFAFNWDQGRNELRISASRDTFTDPTTGDSLALCTITFGVLLKTTFPISEAWDTDKLKNEFYWQSGGPKVTIQNETEYENLDLAVPGFLPNENGTKGAMAQCLTLMNINVDSMSDLTKPNEYFLYRSRYPPEAAQARMAQIYRVTDSAEESQRILLSWTPVESFDFPNHHVMCYDADGRILTDQTLPYSEHQAEINLGRRNFDFDRFSCPILTAGQRNSFSKMEGVPLRDFHPYPQFLLTISRDVEYNAKYVLFSSETNAAKVALDKHRERKASRTEGNGLHNIDYLRDGTILANPNKKSCLDWIAQRWYSFELCHVYGRRGKTCLTGADAYSYEKDTLEKTLLATVNVPFYSIGTVLCLPLTSQILWAQKIRNQNYRSYVDFELYELLHIKYPRKSSPKAGHFPASNAHSFLSPSAECSCSKMRNALGRHIAIDWRPFMLEQPDRQISIVFAADKHSFNGNKATFGPNVEFFSTKDGCACQTLEPQPDNYGRPHFFDFGPSSGLFYSKASPGDYYRFNAEAYNGSFRRPLPFYTGIWTDLTPTKNSTRRAMTPGAPIVLGKWLVSKPLQALKVYMPYFARPLPHSACYGKREACWSHSKSESQKLDTTGWSHYCNMSSTCFVISLRNGFV